MEAAWQLHHVTVLYGLITILTVQVGPALTGSANSIGGVRPMSVNHTVCTCPHSPAEKCSGKCRGGGREMLKVRCVGFRGIYGQKWNKVFRIMYS